MADWRRALSEDEIPAAFRNVYGDRTEKPLSVKGAEIGVEFTPAGTIFGLNDIKNELQKENPDYYKIGMMAGVEAIGLIPGLDKVAVEAIRAGAKKVGLDKVADQTDALLSKPKAEDAVKNEMAGFTGKNPPTYKKRNTPLSQQQDVELDEFRQPQPTEKTELSRKDFVDFRDPIKEFAETVTIPKKGLLGSEFLKMVKKNESIADSSLQPQIIDPKRRYTREELLEAIGDDEGYPGPNVFKSQTYIGERQGSFRNYQRQGQDAGFLGIGKELDYFELPVISNVPSGLEGTGKPFKAKSQHFDEDTIVHARGSIIQPADGVSVPFEYEDLIGQKPFLLVEEIQSDLLQKGYLKPGKLSDAAFKKSADDWSTDNYVSFQEAYGEISKDIQSIFEELDEANIIRPDFVDGVAARGRFISKTDDRGYALSNELSDVLDKLNLEEKDLGNTLEFLLTKENGSVLPIVDVDTGGLNFLSEANFLSRFKKETFVSRKEKTQKFFDKSRELLANKQIDKEIDFSDFQNLYERYKTNQYRLQQEGFGEGFGLPPITKNKQAVEESLKALIAKAAREGVDKIVIPPADRIARARGRTLDSSDKGDRFYRTYVTDLNKVLNDLEKNYPVEVRKNVEMPYDNRLSGPRKLEAIEQGLNTLSSRGELEAFTISSPSIEVSIPEDMNYEILRQAMDREVHAENLTNEQEKVFKAFAKHNQVSLDEAPDVFSQWHVKQTDELLKKPWFQRMLPESETTYGTILDISELVDEYKVEAPRQFYEGGSVRPKLRPGSDRRISPKPRLRPDPERQYGLADVEFRADMDPLLSKDPIARLGFDVSRLRYSVPEGFNNAFYADDYSTDGGLYTERGITFEPDTVNYGPDFGSSKETIAHETRHRGLALLREMLAEDPEYFSERYGKEAAVLLDKDIVNEELLTELFDNPDATYVAPTTGEEKSLEPTVQYVNSDTLRRIRERGSLGPNVPNADIFNKGIVGLRFAAEDMLKESRKEPTGYVDMSTGSKTRSSKKYKPSFFQKLRKKLGFAEGGAVGNMSRQMELFARGGLKDDGMNMDPVSGNEVPSGSLAEEVRDDIPAQLSEGEYVVPADVVRYYGVKHFEDLRNKAKKGLQEMEADGRIGGEPIMAEDITEEDIAAFERMLATGAAEGGLMDKMAKAAKSNKMINERANAKGMRVGYAEGGMTKATYDNPTRIDQIIDKVMGAARQDPNIMQELTKRGIEVSRTTPQMNPQEMDKANPMPETRKAFYQGGVTGLPITPYQQPMGITPGMSQDEIYKYITTPTAIDPMYSVPGGSYIGAGVPITPTAPTAPVAPTPEATTPAASPEYCSSLGMMYDAKKNMCVPRPASSDDGPNISVAGDGKPAFQDWGKELNFTDYESMEEWAKGLSQPMKGGKLAKVAAATMPGPLGLIVGVAPSVDALQNISDLNAARIIAQARGDKKMADMLEGYIEDRIKTSSGLVDMLDELVASGKQKADAYAKRFNFDSMEEVMSTPSNRDKFTNFTTQYGTNMKFKPATESPGLSGDTEASKAEVKKEQVVMQQTASPAAGGSGSLVTGSYTGGGEDNDYPSYQEVMENKIKQEAKDFAKKSEKEKQDQYKSVGGGFADIMNSKARGGLMQKRK